MQRILTTGTRRRIEEIIQRLAKGESVTLKERVELNKYSLYIPFIAGKVKKALRLRESLEANGLL